MTQLMQRRATAAVASLLLGTGMVTAQTLYGFDGNPTGLQPVIYELTGPPSGPGSFPNGPTVSTFPAVGGPICPGLAPTPPAPPLDGDITVNAVTDEIYASDIQMIARYASNGAFLDSFMSPLPVGGMGLDAAGPLIWITDGVIYGALQVPPLYACVAPPVKFAIGPYPVPMGPGFFQTPITDIAYDPGNGSLWGCDLTGLVGNFVPGVAFTPGPFGFFPVSPGPCNLAPTLTGLALDNAFPAMGRFYVTDGQQIAYLAAGGVPAPATFYSPVTCYPVPGPLLSGLAFSSRPITYGVASDSSGGPLPRMGSIGQAVVPNPGLSFTLAGSVPGSNAVLLLGPAPLWPPLVFAGVSVFVAPPQLAVGTAAVDPAGRAWVNLPLPPTLPTGVTLFTQWGVITPLPSLQLTEGAAFTTAFP